ncbi:DNA-directed RNA polymerase II subunit RPB11 [Gregarina niphandrodes]|uniref:DNA-directed RNA polymerase II subunit RPB11 n=1 Tax=Gregarina niphandrodes TaxID=110365 RepID=A0A023BBJ9_GRENI|nr:DNA-directed RNA polymerase II subunit RPB11 [Gregarina niphandrodes]EZG79371.1 DNA-directed RNA polymerase II subunit RPB11 [Gregarina niphandrodes]|eukprot:XP_011129059.1 DNA-directed RNA polymerase II subunit RPB11 [Gregarina niphandrodes]
MASRSSMLNRPGPLEHIELGPGERKIVLDVDHRVNNCISMCINKEDHTLGGLMRNQLLRDPGVCFAGYRNPHPLEPRIEVRCQTNETAQGNDGPIIAVHNALITLREEASNVMDQVVAQEAKWAHQA